jgi:hypothetical protein
MRPFSNSFESHLQTDNNLVKFKIYQTIGVLT